MKKLFRKIKSAAIYISELLRLPQIIMVLILIVISILTIISSCCIQQINPFISSVLSNIFSGLITGIAICLIAGAKNAFHYNTETKIRFLKDVHLACKEFFSAHKALIKKYADKNVSRDNLLNDLYDVMCKGNDIDGIISQSQFNNAIPFNPYKFFVKSLNYDAVERIKRNEILRDSVFSINIETITLKEIIDFFSEMEKNVFILNGKVLSKMREYEIRRNISEKTVL